LELATRTDILCLVSVSHVYFMTRFSRLSLSNSVWSELTSRNPVPLKRD